MSDNGPGYLSTRLARLCRSAGLRASSDPPLHAPHEREAERFIQTLLREWAYRRGYPRSHQRTEALPARRYLARSEMAAVGSRCEPTLPMLVVAVDRCLVDYGDHLGKRIGLQTAHLESIDVWKRNIEDDGVGTQKCHP